MTSRSLRSHLLAGLLAAGLVAFAAPARAVVGAAPVTDPDGVRRHTVALVLARGLCTGVLIERDVVLTAAHCLTRNSIRAVVALDTRLKPRFLQAANVTLHPSFRFAARPSDASGADLALVRLADPAPADMFPASIASFGESGDLTLAGFGISDGRTATAGTLREATMRARALPWRDTRMIAAIGTQDGEPRIGAGGCRGDSGGPVYRAGSSSVVGIVSWSSGAPGRAGACGGLTIATEIGDHADWIRSTASQMRFAAGEPRDVAPQMRAAPRGRGVRAGIAPPAPVAPPASGFPDLSRDSGQ